ncbi:MAG: DUF2975 domain-containing protein [Litoreibacter sp.]|nr:DUF2975 domain-containing protein [Litoreibacter sp.]
MSWLTSAAMIALVLLALGIFANPEFARSLMLETAPAGVQIAVPPETGIVYAVLLLGCLALAAQLYLLWHMRALFVLYARGEILTNICAYRISRIGAGLLLLPLAGLIYQAGSTVLLTLGNPVGERALAISFSATGFAVCLGGALLLFIGIVMQEASRQAEENRAFI